ncbi:HlyIII-domain-containing protein [Tricholoma matsutake]|nr:HlyIII-domain-containing protein [Tricholoma matsutake 945]
MAPLATIRSRRRRSVKHTPHIVRNVPYTMTWKDLSDWQKSNEYIISGYRRVQHHWKGCFISVFAYLHNETINIHSHMWGAVLFLYFLATFRSTYILPHPSTSWEDSAVFLAFLSSAVFCLSGSALYHTSSCHSEEVSVRCHALDYSGIVVLTVGSFYTTLYYGFYCEPLLQVFYLVSITLAGLGAAYTVLNPEYAKPTHRGSRTTVFISLGLSAVIPVSHLLLTHGSNHLFSEIGLGWLLASGALYITGALLYANRIPERFAPGRFDYFFASHQIFHLCVVFAALAHYYSALESFEFRLLRPQFCDV